MLTYATKELYEALDRKADAMREKILNTKTEVTVAGTAYYVCADGNDNNDGKAPERAWKTNARVSEAELCPGDAVFFRRGDIFRGQIRTKAGVTYSAYGEGPKPKIYSYHENAAIPEKWELYDEKRHIWRYADALLDSGTIVFNEGEHVAKKEIPSFVDGAFVCRDDPSVPYVMEDHLTRDFVFFQDNRGDLNEFGRPRTGSKENMGRLYLRYEGENPGKAFDSIEFLPRFNLIVVGGENVTIDNLCIRYAGAHGIGSGTVDGLTVTNCEIGYIGGTIQFYAGVNGRVTRYGNGVEIYGGCHNYTVKGNWIYECYDAGITHQVKATDRHIEMFDIDYSDNLIENCVYSIEYFLSRLEPGNDSRMKNVSIKDNFMRFCGFGWGRQRPGHANAHIKGWDADNPAENFVIENNILDRSTDKLLHIGSNLGEVPRLVGNTYIQYPNAKFGRIGKAPTTLYTFDIEKIDAIAADVFGDKDGTFYIAY